MPHSGGTRASIPRTSTTGCPATCAGTIYWPRTASARAGAAGARARRGGANAAQRGDSRFDTADFNARVPGNLRVDYLLPSKGIRVCGGGVFWPARAEPTAALVWGDRPAPSSDHRLVWL